MRGRITYSTANQGNGIGCPTAAIPMRDQHISYNAMQQPDTIVENGYTATCS